VPTFAENVTRLRVAAATGTIAPDLARWALDVIGEQGPAAERLERRNLLLREAAARMSGSRWAKARRIEQEIQSIGSAPRLRKRSADVDGVRALVRRSLAAGPPPKSLRQLLRILDG
jgi:hypothetical protein